MAGNGDDRGQILEREKGRERDEVDLKAKSMIERETLKVDKEDGRRVSRQGDR